MRHPVYVILVRRRRSNYISKVWFCITEVYSVYSAVRTESLHKTDTFRIWRVKETAELVLSDGLSLPSKLVTVDNSLWPTLEIWFLIYLTNFIISSHSAMSNCRRISKWGGADLTEFTIRSFRSNSTWRHVRLTAELTLDQVFCVLWHFPSPSTIHHCSIPPPFQPHVSPFYNPEQAAHSHIPRLGVQGFVPDRHLAGHGATNFVLSPVSRENPLPPSSCPPVYQHVTPGLPLKRFSWNSMLETSTKSCREIENSVEIRTEHWEIHINTCYVRLYC